MPLEAKKPRLLRVDTDTYEFVQSSHNSNTGSSMPLQHSVTHKSALPMYSQSSAAATQKTPINSTQIGREISTDRKDRKSLKERLTADFNTTPITIRPNHFVTVTGAQVTLFLQLLDFPVIVKYMKYDVCLRTTDKYLMAMAFAYFARAGLTPEEYTPYNLFVALYLAHDMEEDEEDYKYEIFPWALGREWRSKYKQILISRDLLWKRMKYRAVVSRKCCDEIMAIAANHPVWKRNRNEEHAGAVRPWLRDPSDDGKIIGPDGKPRRCSICCPEKEDMHDSLSPDDDKLWLQLESSHSSEEQFLADLTTGSSTAGININDILQGSSYKKKSLDQKGLDWVDFDERSPITYVSEA